LRDADSKYHNHFSRSPLVFPEIEGVNAGRDCFDVLGRTILGVSGPQFMKKSKLGTKWYDPRSFNVEWFVFITFFNENIFYTEKAAILKVYFRKSLITQLLLGIFHKKFVDKINLTSSIHFWYQTHRNFSKSIQKICKIWLFWDLHRQFPGKLEVIQQNGYDLRNQHPSISQKRVFWSL
jgi:hypothetical protein